MPNEKKPNRWKALYLLMAVFVAAFIWFFVDEYGVNGGARLVEKTITGIPLVYTNEDVLADRGLMLVEDSSDATIDLTLKATRSTIGNLDRSKIRVAVDLSNVTRSGEQMVSYIISFVGRTFTGEKLSTLAIQKKDASISSATVNIQELYSKTVDVKCELKGRVADGYTAGELRLSHTAIDIWGQEEDVAPVSYAKITLDIGNAISTVSQALPVQFYTEDGQLVESGIRTTVEEIEATLPVSVTKELRLRIDFQDAPGARLRNVEWELQPETIQVSGDTAQLEGIDSITLTEFDLLSLEQGTNTYVYPITVPSGCTNLSGVTQATLKIAFKDMASAQVTTDQFRYENMPIGKNVDILTEKMTVTVFGPAADVAAITGADITVVADLSDYSGASGSYTVPTVVETNTSGDVGVAGTYQIQVVIREPDDQEENTGEEP